MRASLIVIAAAAVMSVAATASADVQLSIQNGRVTLVAKDATVRQILAEWARVGQTRIVNGERIPGGPVTLELRDVSEQQALRVLLRSLGGYVTAPRATVVADASVFDRIVVMPVTASAPPPPSNAPAPPPAPFAAFQPPPQFQPQLPPDDDRDDAVPPQTPQPGNRGPVFVFPPPAGVNQPPQGTQPQPLRPPAGSFPGAPTTTAPAGVSVPGMIVPAPQPQPGQPGLPVLQPGQQAFPVPQPRVP